MKQTFIIETSDGLTDSELLGCLEDTKGVNSSWSVEQVKGCSETEGYLRGLVACKSILLHSKDSKQAFESILNAISQAELCLNTEEYLK